MKKRQTGILLWILIIMSISYVSSLEINLYKESYQPGETLQAEITGNFVSLKNENILIYKEGIPRSNPVISGLTYQNGIYYFYAILPNQEGNFSLRIENSQYFEQENLKFETIIKNFTIIKTNQSSISINPGFIVADEDFSFKIKSLKDNQNININFEAVQEIKNLSLIEGIETVVDFSISDLQPMKTFVLIKNDKIPVFILKEGNKTSLTDSMDISFLPSEIKGTLLAQNSYFYEIKLFNIGEKNLTKIRISSNSNSVLTPDLIDSLKTKSYTKINLTITPEKNIKTLSGEIIATVNNKNITLPFYFKITEKNEEVNISTGSQLDCNDIGKQCLKNEICNGVIRESKQGQCCLGNCIEIAKSSSNSFFIGIGIFLLVLLILFFFYQKIKQKQKPKTTEEILKERTNEYRNRLAGKEVNKKLDKI